MRQKYNKSYGEEAKIAARSMLSDARCEKRVKKKKKENLKKKKIKKLRAAHPLRSNKLLKKYSQLSI